MMPDKHNEINTQIVTCGPLGATLFIQAGWKFFKANRSYIVRAVKEVHTTAGNQTFKLMKCSADQAIAEGTNLFGTDMDLATTANYWVAGTLTTNEFARNLVAGDELACLPAGSVSSLAGCILQVELEAI